MKTIVYTGSLGPDTVKFGEAGEFIKGQPKEVKTAFADILIAKGYCEAVVVVKEKSKKAPAE
jgi:hypothetical protein